MQDVVSHLFSERPYQEHSVPFYQEEVGDFSEISERIESKMTRMADGMVDEESERYIKYCNQ